MLIQTPKFGRDRFSLREAIVIVLLDFDETNKLKRVVLMFQLKLCYDFTNHPPFLSQY